MEAILTAVNTTEQVVGIIKAGKKFRPMRDLNP